MLSVSFLMAVNSPPSCFSMQSSSRCIDASTLSSMLASPLPSCFLIHIVCQRRLWDAEPYLLLLVSCSLVHLFKFFSGPLQNGSRISNEGYSSGIYPFDKV